MGAHKSDASVAAIKVLAVANWDRGVYISPFPTI